MSDSPWTIRGEKMTWQKGFMVSSLEQEQARHKTWLQQARGLETEAQQEYDSTVRRCEEILPPNWEMICNPPKSHWEWNLEHDYEIFRVRFSIERKPKILGNRADSLIMDDLSSHATDAMRYAMRALVDSQLMASAPGGFVGVDPAKLAADKTTWHLQPVDLDAAKHERFALPAPVVDEQSPSIAQWKP
jgi:hypothetical protein